jgi:poly(A) polymerase
VNPKIYPAAKHKIKQENIDQDALSVLKRLREAGHTAYLVGGSVRDLIVQISPKDFDISTSAKPEEIKRLFRNSLLIGRRFRLAHIRFGKKVFEVSTFRSGDTGSSELILRDNEWGTPEQDVLRRDFTINGLFYDPVKDEVIDYVGGCEDIKKKLLRTIGNPADRFVQDPVRMMRLLKFQARFGFEVDFKASRALHSCQEEILKSSPARILEETFKMLESGSSEPFFRLMVESGLMGHLYPALEHFLKGKYGKDVYSHLQVADQLYHANMGKAPDRAVLTSCLIYPILLKEIDCQFLDRGVTPTLGEIFVLSHTLIRGFVTTSFPHFPRRLRTSMNFILDTQFRLTPITHKKMGRERNLSHEDFPSALKFLKLRSMLNDELTETYSMWEQRFNNFYSRNPNTEREKPRRRSNYRRAPKNKP